MKKLLQSTVITLLFIAIGFTFADSTKSNKVAVIEKKLNSDKLHILWTTENKNTAKNMIAMYANYSKKNTLWKEINIIIWGGSAKLIKDDKEMQDLVKKMIANGINVEACKACADQFKSTQVLKTLGVDVKYMGIPLTKYLKNNEKILTL